MASIGRVLLIPKGDYSSATTYNQLDWVRYSGKAWVCKVDGTVNVTPVQGDTWQLLAQDGSGGGGGASDWDDINYKPFETLETTTDFSVDGNDQLHIKRGTFGTVRVVSDSSGSPTTTDLEASGDATITLKGGTNVTLSADDSANPKKITINSTGGGGGGDTVSWNQIQTSSAAVKIAKITINGSATDVYAPSGGGTVDQTFNSVSTNAQSGVAIAGWTNTMTYRRVALGSDGDIDDTGIGTWTDKDPSQIVSADETTWWYDAAFVIPSSGVDPNSIDIKIMFEPLSDGTPIVLQGYLWDTTTGKICIKFANDISSYKTTAKVAVDITYTRNEVV